jgi:5'(3')-deoxyribonucleotidase
MKIAKIFIDMDDVLNHFTMYALNHLGCNVSDGEYEKYKPEWGWDIVRAANEIEKDLPYHHGTLCPEVFWSNFDREFWASAPVSMDGLLVLAASINAVGRENVFILSRPTGDEACREGKHDWVHNKMPKCLHDKLILANDKTACASPTSLLIDDNEKNCEDFKRAGGFAVLYPRPWNSLGGLADAHVRVISVMKDLLA